MQRQIDEQEVFLRRPPHLIVQAAWKGSAGSYFCQWFLRVLLPQEKEPKKGAPWRSRLREGAYSARQNKSASQRGVLLRPNLARPPSLFYLLCLLLVQLNICCQALFCFLLFLSFKVDSNVTDQTLWTGRVCFISHHAQIPCESRRCTV